MALFGARAYGVARRMQRRNFRKGDRARYWAAVARAIRHARMEDGFLPHVSRAETGAPPRPRYSSEGCGSS
jgi:hypothetical protein